MLLVLFLVFILVPAIELSVLISVGDVFGPLNTVALVFLTAIVGVSLVRSQGLSTLMSVQSKLERGEAPGKEIVEGMMLAAAGLLLLFPGFVTDFIGLLLLTPITRSPIASYVFKRMQMRVVAGGGFQGQAGQNPFGNGSPFGQNQNPFNQDGNTFDGDFERKFDPNDLTPESHQVEVKDITPADSGDKNASVEKSDDKKSDDKKTSENSDADKKS
ncbi:FxsA family protein [Shewanella olleyana]|uniref:FxsA family protein n=1 Tax=Shewanella olleyana TaxID=135626 RepID=UPI00200F6ED7|nr:FxsA family protein [Shewanella olleyana]MCL1067846.1 FxsA family protein [Shewanella olleyana]